MTNLSTWALPPDLDDLSPVGSAKEGDDALRIEDLVPREGSLRYELDAQRALLWPERLKDQDQDLACIKCQSHVPQGIDEVDASSAGIVHACPESKLDFW